MRQILLHASIATFFASILIGVNGWPQYKRTMAIEEKCNRLEKKISQLENTQHEFSLLNSNAWAAQIEFDIAVGQFMWDAAQQESERHKNSLFTQK